MILWDNGIPAKHPRGSTRRQSSCRNLSNQEWWNRHLQGKGCTKLHRYCQRNCLEHTTCNRVPLSRGRSYQQDTVSRC